MTNPLDDLSVDPFEIAKQAAQVIADKTGVAKHDIAGGRAVKIGDFDAFDIVAFDKIVVGEGKYGHVAEAVHRWRQTRDLVVT